MYIHIHRSLTLCTSFLLICSKTNIFSIDYLIHHDIVVSNMLSIIRYVCIDRPETLDKDQSHSTDKSLLCEKCAQIYKFLGFDYSCLHQQNIWMFFKRICFCNVMLKRFKTRFLITNIAYSFILYCLDKDNFHIKICIQYSYPSNVSKYPTK